MGREAAGGGSAGRGEGSRQDCWEGEPLRGRLRGCPGVGESARAGEGGDVSSPSGRTCTEAVVGSEKAGGWEAKGEEGDRCKAPDRLERAGIRVVCPPLKHVCRASEKLMRSYQADCSRCVHGLQCGQCGASGESGESGEMGEMGVIGVMECLGGERGELGALAVQRAEGAPSRVRETRMCLSVCSPLACDGWP